MPVTCETLAEQMALLQDELAAAGELIEDICAAFLVETDPMARMMLTKDLSDAYKAKAEIEYDITMVTMNQIELGCIPPMSAAPTASVSGVGDAISIHERLRKLQVTRYVRSHQVSEKQKPFKFGHLELDGNV